MLCAGDEGPQAGPEGELLFLNSAAWVAAEVRPYIGVVFEWRKRWRVEAVWNFGLIYSSDGRPDQHSEEGEGGPSG